MKNSILTISLIASTSFAFAQTDCTTIRQDKQRLSCFDKASKNTAKVDVAVEKAPETPEPPAKLKPGKNEVFKAKSWHVIQDMDAMTDKKSCTAIYKNAWTIQGTEDNFYVSYRGRGGVKAYTLRVDDSPPDSLQLATSTEKDLSAIILQPSFQRIYSGARVRLQVHTILNSILVEDIDLSGFKEAVDYIRANCKA